MIVSHQLRVIFIKTRKTAGTSIEIALSALAGPTDIITAISAEDEQLRRQFGGRGPQNDVIPWRRVGPRDVKALAHSRRLPRIQNHATARQARRLVGRRIWAEYTTFTVERNPWDRAVSLYYYLYGRDTDHRPTFSQFLHGADPKELSNFHLYAIDDQIAVDRVVRYEDLLSGLSEVWSAAGIPGSVELPRAKGNLRPVEAHDYRRLFSDEDASLIARVCQPEIRAHGYTF